MKNNRFCPKCKSQEIMIMSRSASTVMLPVWPYSSVRCRTYLCTSCGFTEDWVAETKELEKARGLRSTHRDKLMAFRRKFNL